MKVFALLAFLSRTLVLGLGKFGVNEEQSLVDVFLAPGCTSHEHRIQYTDHQTV
jgi:hypothetical protein